MTDNANALDVPFFSLTAGGDLAPFVPAPVQKGHKIILGSGLVQGGGFVLGGGFRLGGGFLTQ
jgi:hypothetical protein